MTFLLVQGAPESRAMLWRKSQMAWLKAYHEYGNDADWFVRGDDDTYMVGKITRQGSPATALTFKVPFGSHLSSALSSDMCRLNRHADDGQFATVPAILQPKWADFSWAPLPYVTKVYCSSGE